MVRRSTQTLAVVGTVFNEIAQFAKDSEIEFLKVRKSYLLDLFQIQSKSIGR